MGVRDQWSTMRLICPGTLDAVVNSGYFQIPQSCTYLIFICVHIIRLHAGWAVHIPGRKNKLAIAILSCNNHFSPSSQCYGRVIAGAADATQYCWW